MAGVGFSGGTEIFLITTAFRSAEVQSVSYPIDIEDIFPVITWQSVKHISECV
jgi:hypothetical protein